MQAVALDVGAPGVGDDLDALAVAAADEAVEPVDQVAARLVEGPLGQVVEQRVQPFGRREGELVLGDGGDRDAVARQGARQVPEMHAGLLLHGGGHLAGGPVELVDGHHPARGHVVGQRIARGVALGQGQHPLLALAVGSPVAGLMSAASWLAP